MRPRFSIAIRLLLPCLLPFLLGMTSSDAERFIAGCAYTGTTVTSICGLKLGDDFAAARKIDLSWQDHDFRDTGVTDSVMASSSIGLGRPAKGATAIISSPSLKPPEMSRRCRWF